MNDQTPTIETRLRAVLCDVLGLSEARAAAIDAGTPLFGAMPELDSMAVAGLLTEIEDGFHIRIEDDEMGGDMLESFGNLDAFVRAKLGG